MKIAETTLRNCIGAALSVALPRALLPRTGQRRDAGRGDEEEDWSIRSALCSETLQRFCPYMEPQSVMYPDIILMSLCSWSLYPGSAAILAAGATVSAQGRQALPSLGDTLYYYSCRVHGIMVPSVDGMCMGARA